MKQISSLYKKIIFSLLLFTFLIPLQQLYAQISVYQYRHVPADKVEEFIKRETTYWSKVAQKAVDAKKMTFWGLFEKVGGYDLPNSSNFLFINGFSNMDSAWSGDTFDPAKLFPKVPYAQMETNSFTTVTSQIFFHGEDWAEAKGVNPAKDFNYVVMNYHLSENPAGFINAEKTIWKPFLQTAMDKKQTQQIGWGNARVLSPTGGDMKFNTISYDLFRTLQDALLTPWAPDLVVPDNLEMIDKMRTQQSARVIYRIVKVISN
ncbi:hypothetical protein [Lacibacter sp.]|uniref:hypothetical protein n=1 Tax=Lacibacter sp. TaxID=1915409 RepID=UPI002B4AE5B8|nr:hypothetical protein [Lacibacter sp.]HLP35604.1 hypothetical protein [Lacibacter sp.]